MVFHHGTGLDSKMPGHKTTSDCFLPSSIDQRLLAVFTIANLETSPCKGNHLGFSIFARCFVVALNVTLGNVAHHVHHVFARLDLGHELAVVALEQL